MIVNGRDDGQEWLRRIAWIGILGVYDALMWMGDTGMFVVTIDKSECCISNEWGARQDECVNVCVRVLIYFYKLENWSKSNDVGCRDKQMEFAEYSAH